MKKAVIILSVLAIVASACGNQTSRNNVENYAKSGTEHFDFGLKKDESPAGFLEFLEKFMSNRETQFSLMVIPLSVNFCTDEYHWDEEKLENDWGFLNSNSIFLGTRKSTEGLDLVGCLEIVNDNFIIYRNTVNDEYLAFSLVFERINGEWRLTSYNTGC